MMRLVMAVVVAATAVGTAPARAAGPTGQACTYAETAADGGRRTGVVTAGPYAGDGTVTCAVQFGAGEHRAPDDAAVSASGSGVVVLAPRVVAAERAPAGAAYVCTTFSTPRGELYWSGGRWTADPEASCDAATVTAPMPSVPVPIPLSGLISIFSDVGTDPANADVGFVTGGYLANANVWDCWMTGGPGGPIPSAYEVVCAPNATLGLDWSCTAVTAGALALGYASLRTSDVIELYGYAARVAADARDAVGEVVAGGTPELEPDLPPSLHEGVSWGEVVTTAECADDDTGWVGVTTPTAAKGKPYHQAAATVAAVPVTAVRCRAADGVGSTPHKHFRSTCAYG